MYQGAFFVYLLLNREMIHIIIAITTIIEMIPTTTPALKMPVITEHPHKATVIKANNNKFIFFIRRGCFIPGLVQPALDIFLLQKSYTKVLLIGY